MIYTLGGGCTGGWYRQGDTTGGVTDSFMLGKGFAVVSSSLNVFGMNCQDLTAAETAMMVKERFVERYGPVRHTIGYGCSGGSYQAHQIADNYPGIFDGIIPACSFPEVGFATVYMITDAWLLDTYLRGADGWTAEQKRAVTGFVTYATAPNVAEGARRIDPRVFCGVLPAGQAAHVPAILESLAACARFPDDSAAYEVVAASATERCVGSLCLPACWESLLVTCLRCW